MTATDLDPAQRFRLELEPHRDTVRVRPIGSLDQLGAAELEAEGEGLLDRGFDAVVLDLSAVTSLSPAGLGTIAALDRYAHRLGARLAVIPGGDLTTGVLRRSGLLGQLQVVGAPTTFFDWSQ